MPSSPNRKKPKGDNGPSAFGRLLKVRREEAGMSQAQLSRAARVSAGHIGTIETGARGNRPGRDTVIALANALGADLDEMLKAAGLPGVRSSDRLPNPLMAQIQRDPRLTARQKAHLIEQYRLLTGDN